MFSFVKILSSDSYPKGNSVILNLVVDTYLTIFKKADTEKLFVDKQLGEILYIIYSQDFYNDNFLKFRFVISKNYLQWNVIADRTDGFV